jgi:tetratricopeptide (TPR) repeat protein
MAIATNLTNSFATLPGFPLKRRTRMSWRVALIALTLTVSSGVSAATDSCGNSPFFDDSVPKEQRADMLLQRAMACVREGKPIQSIALFSELIGIQPENMDAYLNRGSAYIQSGQFELGIADFSHVISLKPDAMEAWYNRGTAFVAAHQYDRAIADLNEAIRLKPDTAVIVVRTPTTIAFLDRSAH